MIFKNINSEDIPGLIICSEPSISSSAIRTKETTIDGRDGTIVEKLGYKTRIKNVEIGLKKDANIDKILSYFSGEGDLIFKNENDKVYRAAIYEQVDLERLLRLRKGSVAFYCQPFKYKRNDIFEIIKDNKVKEKEGKYLELSKCAEQNILDLKLKGSTTQSTRSGKNIFNKKAKIIENGVTKSVLDTGVRITQTHAGQYRYGGIRLGGSELLGKTLRISANWTKSADNVPYIAVYLGNSSSMVLYSLFGTGVSGQIRQITIPNAFPAVGEQVCDTVYILLYSNRDGTGNVGDYVDYTDLIVTVDNDDMTYEDYGASPSPDYPSEIGNVEGKNKFDINQEKEIFGIMLYKYSYYLKPNTKYTISSNCPASSTANIYANSNSSNSAVYINKNQTIQSDENGYFYILVRFKADASDNSTFNLYEKVLNGTYYIQLEEGTVATPYVPHNSLEIKDIGENLLNVTQTSRTYSEGITITVNKDKSITISGTNTSTKTTFYRLADNFVLPAGDYTLSNKNANASIRGFIFYDDGNNFPRTNISNATFTKDTTIQPYIRIEAGITINNQTIYPMIITGTYTEETIPAYKPYQAQKVDFPLSERQKLYEGSYLADDGIHHKRKQIVFDGSDEDWTSYSTTNGLAYKIPILNIKQIISTTIIADLYCDYYTKTSQDKIYDEKIDYGICQRANQSHIIIRNKDILTLAEWKAWLSEHPITVEYELATEEIVPYTTAQQEAYNQLQKLKLYKGQNTMFSLEGSIINLKYLEDTDEKVENQGNIYSKPIIRLEKTVFKEVEIAINGIRFKYNFEEDDYVEIDCEEMTVQYEGLDRNRRLVIDFEFPKLKEGNNDIIMYDGDCIIKCKRKDRWL